ncbi:MAG: Asp23/Gls24 family envelope stress response protein [Ktedonobacterales bacterium]
MPATESGRITDMAPTRDTPPSDATSGGRITATASSLRMTTSGGTMQPGKIEVSARAIATVAGRAVAECYGVVGVAAKTTSPLGIVEQVTPEHYGRGVNVRFVDDQIVIDVYVVLEHGLRIIEIAHNIMISVKFAVEQTLGVRVVRVNVNVQGLRVSVGA